MSDLVKKSQQLKEPGSYFRGLDWKGELLPREIVSFCRMAGDFLEDRALRPALSLCFVGGAGRKRPDRSGGGYLSGQRRRCAFVVALPNSLLRRAAEEFHMALRDFRSRAIV